MSRRAPQRGRDGRWQRPEAPEPPYRPRHAGKPADERDDGYEPRHRKEA